VIIFGVNLLAVLAVMAVLALLAFFQFTVYEKGIQAGKYQQINMLMALGIILDWQENEETGAVSYKIGPQLEQQMAQFDHRVEQSNTFQMREIELLSKIVSLLEERGLDLPEAKELGKDLSLRT